MPFEPIAMTTDDARDYLAKKFGDDVLTVSKLFILAGTPVINDKITVDMHIL